MFIHNTTSQFSTPLMIIYDSFTSERKKNAALGSEYHHYYAEQQRLKSVH